LEASPGNEHMHRPFWVHECSLLAAVALARRRKRLCCCFLPLSVFYIASDHGIPNLSAKKICTTLVLLGMSMNEIMV
jgi:hypothetical protein